MSNKSISYTATKTGGFNRNSTLSGGTNRGKSKTKNNSETETTHQSNTLTLNEHRQPRPLLPINEVINNYSINNEKGRLALVHIAGIGFFEVARVRYWEHSFYYRCFGADPDYEFVQAPNPAEAERLEHEAQQLIEEYDAFQEKHSWTKAGGWLTAPIAKGIEDGLAKRLEKIREKVFEAEAANWRVGDV